MVDAFRSILVHCEAHPRVTERLALARRLAQAHDARVTALYASQPPLRSIPYEGAAYAARELLEADEAQQAAARRHFEAVFGSASTQAGFGAVTGVSATAEFIRQALYADLVVLGQHEPGAEPPGMSADFVPDVVAGCGRPVLVVPYAGHFERPVERAVVAWKETPEAARALAGALPLLVRAREVHVLVFGQTTADVEGARLDLPAVLRQHGVDPVVHAEPVPGTEVGELMLSRVADFDADLLVMGCYGHSRAREWVLGGVSRTVLQSMTVPVLMAH